MNIRAKLAGKISRIEEPSNYQLNKFLYANKSKRVDWEEFHSFIVDTSYINLAWAETQTDLTFYFYPGTSQPNTSYVVFSQVNISVRFFSFLKPDTTHVGFKQLTAELTNFNKLIVFPDAPIVDFEEEIFPNIEVRRIMLAGFSASTENINLWENNNIIKKYETNLQQPATKEYLSTFIPEVKKISLLDPKELLTESYILDNKKSALEVDIQVPGINVYSDLQVTNDYPMMFYHNFNIPQAKIKSIPENKIDFKLPKVKTDFRPDELQVEKDVNKSDVLTDNLLDVSEFDILHKLLEPINELSDEEFEKTLFGLPVYQKEGSKFLYSSKVALLYDAFELGKELQAIMSLKLLLKLRVVRKVLLVTNEMKEKIYVTNGLRKYENIWLSYLNSFLSEYSHKFYPDTFFLSTEQHLENYTIHGMTYEVFKNCMNNDSTFKTKLEMFDCVIVDDLSEEILSIDYVEFMLKNVSPDYLWMLSDSNSEYFINRIKNILKDKEINFLGRDKNSVEPPLSKRYNFDFFAELDEINTELSNEIYDKGQKKLDDIVQFGSILRLQPNALHFIQDSQRRSNFIGNTYKGNKANLLRYHLSKIFSRTDRVLIYSQFEQMGIGTISELLTEMKIDFIIFRQLDSPHEIDEKLEIGRSKGGNLVYLTNINPNGIKFKFPKVSHLINFDNWWNPLIRWNLEFKMETRDNEGITVYNYYYQDSLEAKLLNDQLLLGLTDKNILEVLPRDKYNQICNDKFWGNFFNLPYDIFKEIPDESEIDSQYSLVEQAEQLLSLLGYKITGTEGGFNDSIYTLTGQTVINDEIYSVSAVCVFDQHLDSELVNSIIATYGSLGTKLFIITNGNISRKNLILNESVSLIDAEQLKTYNKLFSR